MQRHRVEEDIGVFGDENARRRGAIRGGSRGDDSVDGREFGNDDERWLEPHRLEEDRRDAGLEEGNGVSESISSCC